MSTVLPPNADPLRPNHSTSSKMALPRIIRMSAMALALAGVASFGVIVYSAYQGKPTTPDQVPLITADNAPVRERPADEGGMQVANRDFTIYSQLDGQENQPGIERLTPAPEQPLDPVAPDNLTEPRRPDGTPALTNDEIRILHQQRRALMQQRGDAGEQAMEQLSEAANNLPAGVAEGQTSTVQAQPERIEAPAAPAPVAAAPDVVASAPAAAPVTRERDTRIVASYPAALPPAQPAAPTTAPVADQEQQISSISPAQIAAQHTHPLSTDPVELAAAMKPTAPAAAAPTAQEERQAAAVAPAAGASRLIQLGAVRTQDAARSEWRRLQTKYHAQLGSLEPQIQQADLGARGIYWRIRGGMVNDADGRKICEALKAAGQSCLVVGP